MCAHTPRGQWRGTTDGTWTTDLTIQRRGLVFRFSGLCPADLHGGCQSGEGSPESPSHWLELHPALGAVGHRVGSGATTPAGKGGYQSGGVPAGWPSSSRSDLCGAGHHSHRVCLPLVGGHPLWLVMTGHLTKWCQSTSTTSSATLERAALIDGKGAGVRLWCWRVLRGRRVGRNGVRAYLELKDPLTKKNRYTCPDAATPHPRAAGMPPRRIVRGPKRWRPALGALRAGRRSPWWPPFINCSRPTGFHVFVFPMIEDLINQAPFISCLQGAWNGMVHWTRRAGLEWPRPRQRQQAGSLSHRASLPPLLHFGLGPWGRLRHGALPFANRALSDFGHRPSSARHTCMRGLSVLWFHGGHELQRHVMWTETPLGVRDWAVPEEEAEAIAGVTSKRDLGLTALLVVLTQWGDTCYPYAVGAAPCYSIFQAQPGHLITIDEVPTIGAMIAKLRPGIHDEFLLSLCLVDADKGFGTHPMTWTELLRRHQGPTFSFDSKMRYCAAYSGKKRIIDDAAAGGQSELSSDCNKHGPL